MHRILALQLLITTTIGVFALASLSWASKAIVENNLSHWAQQWTSQLNELGAPFYVTDERSALLDVERFVATYPEVSNVIWYDEYGAPLFFVGQEGAADIEPEPLNASDISQLSALANTNSPSILDHSESDRRRFRLAGPIWSESIVGDGLMSFSSDSDLKTEQTLHGFLGLELDYSWYYEQLESKLWLGSLFLAGVLALSWVVANAVLKRSLKSLSELNPPLRELAKGNMNVSFPPSRYDEIQKIARALQDTAQALEQRDRRLFHLATRDPLTGLWNRALFVEQLSDAITDRVTRKRGGAVLFIDLDQFKYINDTCGHPAGDELLKVAAKSIASAASETDDVARFGGDEFTVFAREASKEHATQLAEDIIDKMKTTTQIHGDKVFHLQCSIGVAMLAAGPFDAHDYIAQADIACYAAKSKGRNRLEFYQASEKENQQMSSELRSVQIVRRALENGAFTLLYQPLLDVSSNTANEYEVLLRLNTETGALVGPDAFLPAAARFGLLNDVDRWVIEQSVIALAKYRLTRPSIRFWINLSASVLDDESFEEYILGLLATYDVPPDAITFEITEQTAVGFSANADDRIDNLTRQGITFAIDDFGKGYSAFNYLKRLPVQFLKIDGSFIENIENDPVDQTMVRAIAQIAGVAGLETVAEHVPSSEALRLLRSFGVRFAQGHFIRKPLRSPGKVNARAIAPQATPRKRRAS